MPYYRTTATWSGFSGAPGYTRFRWLGTATPTTADSAIAKSRAFFAAMSTYLPTGVSIGHQLQVEQYDDNHMLIGYVQAPTSVNAVAGATAGAFSSRAGGWINWATDSFANGRRVAGRTFLVPLAPDTVMQSDGTTIPGFQQALVAAGDALRTGTPTLVIPWKRPVPGGGVGLGIATVTACSIKDKCASLRSRGD